MNVEKLRRLQAQVRIGGKGTPRRKKKVLHQTAATDDKKLQSSLKKLSVSTIPGIEEVNIIKDDLTVIHFNNPKAQASLSANTFAVTGHGETKKVVEMLPEILPQLGQETVVQLRMFANSMAGNQKQGNAATAVGIGAAGDNLLSSVAEEDDVPMLVSDFDEVAKLEAISVDKESQTKEKPQAADTQLQDNNTVAEKVTIAEQASKSMDAKLDETNNISVGEKKQEQRETKMNINVTSKAGEKSNDKVSGKDAKKGKKQGKNETKVNEKPKNNQEATAQEKPKDKQETKPKEQTKDNKEVKSIVQGQIKHDAKSVEQAKDKKEVKSNEKDTNILDDKQISKKDAKAENKSAEVKSEIDSQPKKENLVEQTKMAQIESQEVETKAPDANKKPQKQNNKAEKTSSKEAKILAKTAEDNQARKSNETNKVKAAEKPNTNKVSNVEANSATASPSIKSEENLAQQAQQLQIAVGEAAPKAAADAEKTTEQTAVVADRKLETIEKKNQVEMLKSVEKCLEEVKSAPESLPLKEVSEDQSVTLETKSQVSVVKEPVTEKPVEVQPKAEILPEVLKSATQQPASSIGQEKGIPKDLPKLEILTKPAKAPYQVESKAIPEPKVEIKAMAEVAQQDSAQPQMTKPIAIQAAVDEKVVEKSEAKSPITTSPPQKASPPKQSGNKKTVSPTKESVKQQSKPTAAAPAVVAAKSPENEPKKTDAPKVSQPTAPKASQAQQQQQQTLKSQNATAKGQQSSAKSPPTTPTKTPDKLTSAPKPATPSKAATPPAKTQATAKKVSPPTTPTKAKPAATADVPANNQKASDPKVKPATQPKQPAESANKTKQQNVNKARPVAAKNAPTAMLAKQAGAAQKPEEVATMKQPTLPAQLQSATPAQAKPADPVAAPPQAQQKPAPTAATATAPAQTQSQPQSPTQP